VVGLPEPKPGLVIRYAYLWRDEARDGRIEGRKDRPCVVVLAAEETDGGLVVTVAPITHAPPHRRDQAIEMPLSTCRRLGLDDDRSWIIASEVNRFIWPGPDLRPARRGAWAFGFVPRGVLLALRERMVAIRQVVITSRRED
jgi:hypothetical protein